MIQTSSSNGGFGSDLDAEQNIEMFCFSCGAERRWAISHRYIEPWGICHCYQCLSCGKIVPEFAVSSYRASGKIVIPV